jgi:hypothetical protein
MSGVSNPIGLGTTIFGCRESMLVETTITFLTFSYTKKVME